MKIECVACPRYIEEDSLKNPQLTLVRGLAARGWEMYVSVTLQGRNTLFVEKGIRHASFIAVGADDSIINDFTVLRRIGPYGKYEFRHFDFGGAATNPDHWYQDVILWICADPIEAAYDVLQIYRMIDRHGYSGNAALRDGDKRAALRRISERYGLSEQEVDGAMEEIAHSGSY